MKRTASILLLVAWLVPVAAHCASWDRSANATFGYEYNDNWLLRHDEQVSSSSTDARLAGSITRETRVARVRADLAGRYRWFDNGQLDPIADGSVTLSAAREFQRDRVTGSVGYARLSSLLTGFDEGGLIGVEDRQGLLTAALGYEHDWGARTRLNAQARIGDLQVIDQDPRFPRADTRSWSLRIGADHEFSARTRLLLGLNADFFASETPGSVVLPPFVIDAETAVDLRLVGPSAGVRYELSPTLVLVASASVLDSDVQESLETSFFIEEESASGLQYAGGLSLGKVLPRGSVRLTYDQSNRSGTARGELVTRDAVGIIAQAEWSPSTIVRFDASAFTDDRERVDEDNTGALVGLSVVSRLRDSLRMTFAYTFRQQDLVGVSEARGHGLNLTFTHDLW